MPRLAGKVAIVTGGAMGMGEATVRRFVAEGARVVVADVRRDDAEALADELGDAAVGACLDVRDESDWASVIDLTMSRFGQLDVLINNAGVWRTALLVEETLDNFEDILAVNLRGVFLGMRAVSAPMRAAGGGAIVNTSSTAGLTGHGGQAAYGASKWGVRGMTKVAALEFGQWSIRVNSIHPGFVTTAMTAGRTPEPTMAALPRVGEPRDVANLHLFLASDEAEWITGAEIYIDGGLSAGRIRPEAKERLAGL